MADTTSEALRTFEARWGAIFAREQAQFAAYDAGNPTVLDAIESLEKRMDDLGHNAMATRDRQHDQGMGY